MLPRDMDPRRVLEFARHVDELGFDELWVVEDLGFRGGIAQAAATLAVTERIRVGVGILPAAVRNVAYTAMEAATLAQLFPGRVDFGIGHGMPGWMRALGVWPDRPLRFLGDQVVSLKALLRGESIASLVDGDDPIVLDPHVVPAVAPDVVLGVRGPKSLRVSGQVADGTVLAEPCTPEYVRAAIGQIDAAGPHRVIAYNIAAVAPHPKATRSPPHGPGWSGSANPTGRRTSRPSTSPRSSPRCGRAAGRPPSSQQRLPDEWVARLALAGTAAQVRARIGELGEAGVTSAVLIPVGPDPLAAADALAEVLERHDRPGPLPALRRPRGRWTSPSSARVNQPIASSEPTMTESGGTVRPSLRAARVSPSARRPAVSQRGGRMSRS